MNLIQSETANQNSSSVLNLDPRIKIISMTAFILVIGLTPSSAYLKFVFYFCAITAFFVLSKIDFTKILSRLLILIPLLVFLGLSVFLFGTHTPLKKLNILWNLSVKSILIFLCISFLVLSTRFIRLIKGFELLKIPSIVISILIFAHRYTVLFAREVEKMWRAKQSRTYEKQKITHKIKTLTHLVRHVFFRALKRSENIYAAMLSRGFDRKIETLTLLKMNKKDWFIFSLFVLYLISVLVIL